MMTGKKLGDFEITGDIGKGGMGQVYKGRQLSLDRDVAVKILPGDLSEVEEFRERFDIEAKAVASLIHENIIQMYGKGVSEDGVHYFAMEYVDGEDLAEKIKRGVTFSEKEAISIVSQVCRGLEAAGKKNIIHRDIKPSNIIFTKEGIAKIADFGLAKSMDATKKMTQTNMYMGTVAYTSPEQGEGKRLDQRTDIYSLGIVLYQLLTGRVPFNAETPSSIIYKHVYEAPPAPRSINQNLSPEIEAVVLKAIAKKPEDRFQNATEFREALESAAGTLAPKSAGMAAGAAAVAAVGGVSTQDAPKQHRSEIKVPEGKNDMRVLVAVIVVIILLGGSALYASKYGYRSLFAKVIPSLGKEEAKNEAAPMQPVPAQPAPVASPQQQAASAPEQPTPPAVHPGSPAQSAGPGLSYPAKKEQQLARYERAQGPAARTAAVPPVNTNAPAAPKRSQIPAVLVVASGEANISDIVESVVSKNLKRRSFPLSGGGEIQALEDRYGRHGIPLSALNKGHVNSDILIYISVSTMNAAPLHFYGRTMEQYASTISIKAVDTATGRAVLSPITKTVNYTSLNMQDNVEEATQEISAALPKKIESYWKN